MSPISIRTILLLLVAGGVGACSTPPESPADGGAPVSVNVLAFGDSGYHYDYLEADELEPALTAAQFDAKWRAEWLEDKRPLADYALPATVVLPRTGGVVEASGLAPVATAMTRFCAEQRCDFAAMLGDNIYPDGATLGADGHDDAERFRKVLYEPLSAIGGSSAEFRIYTVLGNHDWNTSRQGALAQLAYLEKTPPFHMEGLVYRVQPPQAHGLVEIFAIDTTLLLGALDVPEALLDDDGGEVQGHGQLDDREPWTVPQTDVERHMAQWLEQALASSTARWKIVIGHHPLWSSAGSKFEQARVLRNAILPSLCRYADIYLAGHDHTLEVQLDRCNDEGLEPRNAPLLHVVSGAAAKQRPLNGAFMEQQSRDNPRMQSLWARGLVWGFAHLQIGEETVRLRMVTTGNDGHGEPVIAYSYMHPRRSGST